MITTYEKTLNQKIEKVKEDFLNSTYKRQVLLYRLALDMEYYEALMHLVKYLPDLPEEFMEDVENAKY